jgi:hypothetical protein
MGYSLTCTSGVYACVHALFRVLNCGWHAYRVHMRSHSATFYKSLLGIDLSFEDLERVDIELHKSLQVCCPELLVTHSVSDAELMCTVPSRHGNRSAMPVLVLHSILRRIWRAH